MVLRLNPALQANPPAGVPFIDGHGLGSAGPPPVPASESRALIGVRKGFLFTDGNARMVRGC